MHYEINVSQLGHHVFATHPRSLTSLAQAAKVYVMLTRAFPASEGFVITVTRQYEKGEACTQDIIAAALEFNMWAKDSIGGKS